MKKFLAASALALAFGFAAAPVMAADEAACAASWSKLDAKKTGYVMTTDAKAYMDAMSKAGQKTAAADRISDKEYMAACRANIFDSMPR